MLIWSSPELVSRTSTLEAGVVDTLEEHELALLERDELARLLERDRIESSRLGRARQLAGELVELLEVGVALALHGVAAVRRVHEAGDRGDQEEADGVDLAHDHGDDAEARGGDRGQHADARHARRHARRSGPPASRMTVVIAADCKRFTTTAARTAAAHDARAVVLNMLREREEHGEQRDRLERPSARLKSAFNGRWRRTRTSTMSIPTTRASNEVLRGAEEQPDHQRQLVHRERVRVVAHLDVHRELSASANPIASRGHATWNDPSSAPCPRIPNAAYTSAETGEDAR